MGQLTLGASVLAEPGQLSVSAKSPLVRMLEIERSSEPVFCNVTACGGLVCPTGTLPKSRDFGATVATGTKCATSRIRLFPWSAMKRFSLLSTTSPELSTRALVAKPPSPLKPYHHHCESLPATVTIMPDARSMRCTSESLPPPTNKLSRESSATWVAFHRLAAIACPPSSFWKKLTLPV